MFTIIRRCCNLYNKKGSLENTERAIKKMNNPEKLATLGTQYTRRRQTKQKHNSTIWVGHHYTQRNTNKVKKTRSLLQTTGGKEEPNIEFIRKL